jgi:hypothetical protein
VGASTFNRGSDTSSRASRGQIWPWELVSRVHELSCVDATPLPKANHAADADATPATQVPSSSPPAQSYASKAKSGANNTPTSATPKVTAPKVTASTTASKQPAQHAAPQGREALGSFYVVQFQGSPPPNHISRSMTSTTMVTSLCTELSKDSSACGLCLLMAQYNKTGNIVMSFPKGTDRKLVDTCHPTICQALGIPATTPVNPDLKWSKLVVMGVPNDATATAADLGAEFQLSNPQIVQGSKVHVTLAPRWVKDQPQVVFAVEDPTSAVAGQIIQQGVCLFGRLCPVREFLSLSPSRSTNAASD